MRLIREAILLCFFATVAMHSNALATSCDVSALSPTLYYKFEETSVSVADNQGSLGATGDGVLFNVVNVAKGM